MVLLQKSKLIENQSYTHLRAISILWADLRERANRFYLYGEQTQNTKRKGQTQFVEECGINRAFLCLRRKMKRKDPYFRAELAFGITRLFSEPIRLEKENL